MLHRNNESGQMSVELVVALPVLLLAMVIAVDAMVFMGECARFDHLAAQAVLAQGASPGADAYDQDSRVANVRTALEGQFAERGVDVTVEAGDAGGVALWHSTSFTCTMEMAPWPLSRGGANVFGMRVPTTLRHSYTLAVDAYAPGQL